MATYLDRRQLLKALGAGGLAAGAAVALSPATALAADDQQGAEGGWNININPTGGASRKAAIAFAAGGALTTADSLGPGAVGVGAWDKQEGNAFAFQFTVFDFSHGGVPVVVTGKGTATGNSIQGSFSATVFGNPVGDGTFDGVRIVT